jgi:Protein of unknown function (DUF1573)
MNPVEAREGWSEPRSSVGRSWRGGLGIGIVIAVVSLAVVAGWFVYHHLQDRPQAKSDDAGGPVRCREPVWDFGTIDQAKPQHLNHTFKVENVSGETVRVEKVMTDCGCVVADNHPNEIPPRTVAQFTVSVHAAGNPGPFEKQVHVILATSPASRLTLGIRGHIAPSSAFYLVPEKVDFGTLGEGETGTRTVKIARYDGTCMAFLKATPKSAALSVKEVVRGEPGEFFIELTLSLDGSALELGNFAASVVVTTDRAEFREIEVPVVARRVGQMYGLVGSVFVDRLSKGAFQDKPLVAGGGPPPRVEAVRYEGDGPIAAELLAAKDGGIGRTEPAVRVSRKDEPTDLKVCRGKLVVTLAGRSDPVQVPLSVYLSD